MNSIAQIVLQAGSWQYSQDKLLEFVEHNMKLEEEAVIQRLFNSIKKQSHICSRYSCLSDNYFSPNSILGQLTTSERQKLYEEHSKIITNAICKKVKELGTDLHDINNLVTVSCTGYQTPGLDFLLMKNFSELQNNLSRFHIGAMGCYAGIIGLKLASQLPGNSILLCLELCSLHFQASPVNFSNVVSNSLFADGVSLLLLKNNFKNFVSPISFHSAVIPNTVDKMSWLLRDTGFRMHLDPKVPRFIEENIKSIVDSWLEKENISIHEIKGWVVHPGGYSILESIERALCLGENDLQSSKKIFNKYGNMSSCTVFFILDDLIKNNKFNKGDRILMMAFGPGLTAELCLLQIN
ncbi:MAG: type III polyketide synthase [Candidatus Caenarcaniphilales bacterium]|nr:type III polyketide synthase [Candidatus Caenarcaniphilales bacterium]